jgi:basic membrane lipoprotein Med (substrate-binding protein (PBP1-ABC) superfamily)
MYWFTSPKPLTQELYGIEWTYVEFVTMEERERVLRNLAGQGYDMIIDQDTLSWDAINKVAPDFPDIWFGNPYGAAPDEILQPNVFCMAPYTEDGAYLTGMIAGGMTNSNKIGFPVAFIFPFMTSTFEAIKAGAKAVNPEAQGIIVETFTWTDAPKGKESAEALIDQGIDVLVHLSEAVDAGIVQAAGEHGVITISGAPNGDNSGFYERNVATFSYRVDKAIVHVIGLYVSGQLENKLYGGGLSDMGWSDVWLEHPEWIPDDLAGQVFKAREQILSGELVIPFIPEPTPP